MFKGKNIYLRLFEPDDYEKTYHWRNDYSMQKLTCGLIRFVSKEIEKKWVYEKSVNNSRDIYIAICANENDQMVGYMSLNDIDYINRSCVGGGIVIGDSNYRDGSAYVEAELMEFDYVFNHLNLNRYFAECLDEHILSRANLLALNFKQEGKKRQAVFKNGKYYDVLSFSLLRNEYYEYLAKGEYDIQEVLSNTSKNIRIIRKELKNRR